MEQRDFEELVKEAILSLPQEIRQKAENVAICIEERPTEEQLKQTGIRYGRLLLGLYEGIPQVVWGKGFGGNLPDKISIFQESIERLASTPAKAKELVRNVVWHEIAHHFGFSEHEISLIEKRKLKNK